MTRTVETAMDTQISADSFAPILLIEGRFASGVVRIWNGYDPIPWDGKTWQGKGDLIGFSGVEETQEIEARSASVILTGIKSSLISLALDKSEYRGKPIKVWFGAVSGGSIVVDPIVIFNGRMDTATIQDEGETATIEMKCESVLASLTRSKVRRYTDEDQKRTYPSDKFFEFVTAIQDTAITWGQV